MRTWSLAGAVAVTALVAALGSGAPARAGAIDESMDHGQAIVTGSVDRQGFELLFAYAYLVEEGPAPEDHYTVVVLSDRELEPTAAHDLERLRAEGKAGRLKALWLELNDGTGDFRGRELIGPEGMQRAIPGRVRWTKEEWTNDRIVGSVFFYQGTQWGFSGPFKSIIRLGLPLDADRARGTVTAGETAAGVGFARVREWDDGTAPLSTILLTDREVEWNSDPDPESTRAAMEAADVRGALLVLGNQDGELRTALCLGVGEELQPGVENVDWTREEWDDRVMRGRFVSSADTCGFDLYFHALVR